MLFEHTAVVRRLIRIGTCAILIGAPSSVSAQEPIPGEIVQTTGDPIGSAQDLAVFFARTKLAFIGTFESASPVVIADRHHSVFTRMIFKPTEFIKGSPPAMPSGTLEVWRLGGSYVETPTGRQPVRPAGFVRLLQPGGVYFVASNSFDDRPGLEGRYILRGDDSLVRVEGGQAVGVGGVYYNDWATAVIRQGRAAMPTPGILPDDAAAFLTAIRHGAAGSR